MKYCYLAIDIGASSGRFIVGHLEGGKLLLHEIYRFDNGPIYKAEKMCWDLQHIFDEIIKGLIECGKSGWIPVSVGIDTWGLDFVLLDEKDRVIGDVVNHRDKRTAGIYEEIYRRIEKRELYQRTGVQMAEFNTSCQLAALQRDEPQILEKAQTLLMIPDYLHFLLTGEKVQEYSNASTTQLTNPDTCDWDKELIERLGFPERIFLPVQMSGKTVGCLKPEIAEQTGFSCTVVLPPTHDTASAFMTAFGFADNTLYISSGTWSLVGALREQPLIVEEAVEKGFTNEGGYGSSILYLKNSMGLWLIQQFRKELPLPLSFAKLCDMAEAESIETRIDCKDSCFLAPESISGAIDEYCERTQQRKPESIAQYAAVIYHSLALSYRDILLEIEEITKKTYDEIHVFGGGSKAGYLNRLTSCYTGKRVIAGPAEASAIGNLMAQMIAAGEFAGLPGAKECVKNSFDIEVYEP